LRQSIDLDDGGPIPDGPPSSSSHLGAILAGIATATSSVFIGRAAELGRLSELLEMAEQGRRAVGVIAGDAGVGKTRLLGELAGRADARGIRVLVGGCMETGDVGLPYVPFVDAFRGLGGRPGEAELLRELVGVVPHLGRLFPTLGVDRAPPVLPNDEFEQVELFGGIHSLLMQLSERAPLLVVVEDVHWADRSTRDLLAFLVRTLRSGRIALITSYRSDELHRRHPLRPVAGGAGPDARCRADRTAAFYPGGADRISRGIAGERADADAVDRILARSEGNAFFAEELLAAGAMRTDVVLPHTLADLLRDRIETLSEPAQEILKVASVAGRKVSHGLLVAAADRPEPDLEPALREAIAGQVMVADPVNETYQFRHALMQEAVYGDLLPGERTRLHATYARVLAESGPAAELAHHCLSSHDLPGALNALVRAAGDATAVSAPAEALSHLTRALELWDGVADASAVVGVDRADLLLRTAMAAGNSGEFRLAVGLARKAVAGIDPDRDPLRAARAYERLGECLYLTGVVDETLDVIRRAVELVPAQPPTALRARVTAGLARALLGARRYEEARKLCDEALAVAKQVNAAEHEIHALITLAVLEERHDNPRVARSLLRDARTRTAAVGARGQELRAQFSIGALELNFGDLPAACASLDESAALADRTGLSWSQYGVNSGILRCFAYYAAGRWDDAERLAGAFDERMSEAAALSAVAMFVEVGRGRAGAEERLRRLQPLTNEDDWVVYLGGGCGVDLTIWQGDLDRARVLAARVLSVLAAADEAWELSAIWPATLGLAAEAERAERARLAGNHAVEAEARSTGTTLLEQSREAERRTRSFGRQIGPEALAWLARAEAEWARLEGRSDPDRWATAVEAFSYGYVYEEARCRWRLAEALLARGRRDEATEQARAAHAVAQRLGAEPLRTAIESLSRRGRLGVGERVEHSGTAAGLTAREMEVLRLLAKGRSNQQIADALFISRKTASVHVSHILTKLEVGTRVEAAAVAHRLGLDDSARPD
jgi:DNA-binding NarL/FixJ family response regulator/tetratricopeptide (TPR) repeat protein